jgi:signal transduction histidine kinase
VDIHSEEMRESIARLFRAGQVGQCVNSVAHDVNNYLGAVFAYVDLLQLDAALSSESQRMLGQISDAVQKCSTLISSLTSIARKEKPDVCVIDAPRFLEQTVELRRHDFKTDQVSVEVIIDKDIPSLVLDLPRMRLAILYLLTNALEAVQGSAVRRVRVQAHRKGDAVEIVIWNSGPAVPEGDQERMFEPFFTTKGVSHMGLGLTLARETARFHDGDLAYDATRGFVMRLPYTGHLARER